MIGWPWTRRLLAGSCVVLTATSCSFQGVNSLPLPGTQGHQPNAVVYHVEIANVGALERNSPVMIGDVTVGSIGKMTVKGWHADVEVSLRPEALVPQNAVARVGQTSLLGSMHLELDPPTGQAPLGRLAPGATIPLNQSSTYPSTEQTLASLSLVVNGGGLGQVGDIIHNFNAALSGRQSQVRDLLSRLDELVGTFDGQRDRVIATLEALDRFAATLSGQHDVIEQALRAIPPALDVLLRERPRITTALEKLRVFSDTATRLVNDTQGDLVRNLQNLEPTIRAIADVGPELDVALAAAPIFPFNQNLIDRALRGDYFNLFAIIDLTAPRLKRTLFLGTRWGQEGMPLVPAPGEPFFNYYTYDPLNAGVAPPPDQAAQNNLPSTGPAPSDAAPPQNSVPPAEPPAADQGGPPPPATSPTPGEG
jgi:virulence factor Mce-like protein